NGSAPVLGLIGTSWSVRNQIGFDTHKHPNTHTTPPHTHTNTYTHPPTQTHTQKRTPHTHTHTHMTHTHTHTLGSLCVCLCTLLKVITQKSRRQYASRCVLPRTTDHTSPR